jgi:anti-anti-sigma factor
VITTEELDTRAAARLHGLLDMALALQPGQLVVDLTACPFLDAATIGVLLDVHRRAWRAGGQLTLRSPSPRLRRILQLSRVDHVFHITPTISTPTTSPQPGPRCPQTPVQATGSKEP